MKFDNVKVYSSGFGRPTPEEIICSPCYAKEHLSSQCPVKKFQFSNVVTNYESLTEEDKKKVPEMSFQDAK